MLIDERKIYCDPNVSFVEGFKDGCITYHYLFLVLFCVSSLSYLTVLMSSWKEFINSIHEIRMKRKDVKLLQIMVIEPTQFLFNGLLCVGCIIYLVRHSLMIEQYRSMIPMAVLLGLGITLFVLAYIVYPLYHLMGLEHMYAITQTSYSSQVFVVRVVKILVSSMVLIIILWILSFSLYWPAILSNIVLLLFGVIPIVSFFVTTYFYYQECNVSLGITSLKDSTKSRFGKELTGVYVMGAALVVFLIVMVVQTIWIPKSNRLVVVWLIINRFVIWLLGTLPIAAQIVSKKNSTAAKSVTVPLQHIDSTHAITYGREP